VYLVSPSAWEHPASRIHKIQDDFNPKTDGASPKRDICMMCVYSTAVFYTRDVLLLLRTCILLLLLSYNIREPVERFLRLSGPVAAHVAPHVNMTNPRRYCGRTSYNILYTYIYIYIYVNHGVTDRGPRDLCARILRISSWSPTCRPLQFSRFFDFINPPARPENVRKIFFSKIHHNIIYIRTRVQVRLYGTTHPLFLFNNAVIVQNLVYRNIIDYFVLSTYGGWCPTDIYKLIFFKINDNPLLLL